jgi:hypothetical protein
MKCESGWRAVARLVTVVFAVLGLSVAVLGQAEDGSISGTVKDATGAVIPGATVTAKNLATGVERAATTGNIGQYQIPALTPGNYQVTITLEKFRTYRTSTEVTVGSVSTVDAQLTVGQSSAVIEVVGGSGHASEYRDAGTIATHQHAADGPIAKPDPQPL